MTYKHGEAPQWIIEQVVANENELRLHQIIAPGNYKAEMIFEFGSDGAPSDVEVLDIDAKSHSEAAEIARKRWGWSTMVNVDAEYESASYSPRQSRWKAWGGNTDRQGVAPKMPEGSFPRHKRFVVHYEHSSLSTENKWIAPHTRRQFRLADSAVDALASVQAELDDPTKYVPGFHVASNARVTPCPEMPAYFDTYCRFGGGNDIRRAPRGDA